MEECGVGRPLNQWFRDYLTARSFRVKVGSALSDEQAVRCGVPQGSGCGPLCYLMHVNSLCGVLRHCSAHMFADDLCTLRAGTDLEQTCKLVQEDVDAVVKWSHDNGIGKMDSDIDTPRSSRLPSRARLVQSRSRRWRSATVYHRGRCGLRQPSVRGLKTDVVTTAGADDAQMTRTKKDRGSHGEAQEGPTVEDVIKHVTSIVI
ncbi:uncharacterized protein LOC134674963 [Cydia fagiglandana]|uniref:uncharacterized protein LOC134674963 n=1 Tax=Cydia fagiglandana TaxID=1458189 RepID=UPI002FEE00AF